MKKIILLFVLTVFAVNGHAQFIVAEDKAENYNTWTNGNNQGIGFGNWDMWKEGSGGWFINSSSSGGFGNIDTNSKSFGMWGNPVGNNYSNAQRILSNYWGDGATFSIQLAIANRNGNKGIDLFEIDGTELKQIWNFNVGSDKYQIGGTDLGWSYSQTSVFTLSATQNSSNIYITLTRGSDSYSTTIIGKTLYAFKLYNGSTSTGNLNNLFFNNLKISYSDWSKVPSNIKVKIEGNGTLNANKTVSDLEINSEVTASVAAGKQLTITGTATNNGTIKLLSNGTDGTATLVGNVGGNAEVQQYLASQRNWYMSSPVAAAARPDNTGYPNVESYNETTSAWVETSGSLEVGRGYVIYPNATVPKTITFTGALNTGDKTIGLTRTTSNTTYQGFNLVGNPYPSYLNAKSLLDNNTASVSSTIWYRTNASGWTFYTYNATSDVSVPANTNLDKIPPMQGFWVRAISDNVTLNFDNDWRLHNETATSIPFKAPAAAANQILRLQLTNGTATDETVLYFNTNAADGYDAYDSPKMMNNGTTVPNLYTTVGTEKLVINGMNAIPYNVELPLSLQGAAGNYTITASEFSNFAEGDKVQLIDNGIPTDLTLGSSYTFSIAAGENTTGRFSVVFPKSGVPTGVNNAGAGDVTVFTRSSRIVVTANEAAQGSMIYVFNGVGQRLAAQAVSGTVNEIGRTFPAGVYVVKVNNVTAKVVVK